MAKSKYEYVKQYENDNILLKSTFIIIRIDGRGFTLFTKKHKFTKPNDIRALNLMNRCAICVMDSVADIILAYGQSDEFSEKQIYTNEEEINSYQQLCHVFHQEPPMFDGRAVMYPTIQSLRDYLSWRQADCHINNLYNTCFWALVEQGKLSNQEAQAKIKDTVSADKNELLFSEFGINYNNEKAIYRKGSVLIREPEPRIYNENNTIKKHVNSNKTKKKDDSGVIVDWKLSVLHVDIIRNKPFWNNRPWLLDTRKPALVWKEYIKQEKVNEMKVNI